MSGVSSVFTSIMNFYTPDRSLAVIRAACVACSVADISFILILLKMVTAIKPPGAPKPRVRTLTMYVFAALTPTLMIPGRNASLFLWQSFVLGAPYLILAYTAIKETPLLLRYMRGQIRPKLEIFRKNAAE